MLEIQKSRDVDNDSIRILGTGLFFSWEELHKIEGDAGVYPIRTGPTDSNRILVMKDIIPDDGERGLVVDTLELPSSSSPNIMLSASQKLTKNVEL